MTMRHTLHTRPILTASLIALLLVGVTSVGSFAQAQPSQAMGTPARTSSALGDILKELATYNGGIESAAVWKLRDYVNARRDDAAGRSECETALLQFLKSTATPAAKLAASRHLRVIAGDTAVPALQTMLADERLSDLAVYALQQIPGAAADRALMQSLVTTSGATRIAVVAALGERRVTAALPALAPLLQQPATATAAATAIGRIGGDTAAASLTAAYAAASPPLKATIAASLMNIAEQYLAAKNAAPALRLYESLASDASLSIPLRTAAALGRISASGSSTVLMEYLATFAKSTAASPDAFLQAAVISRIRDVITPDGIGAVCALLPRLSETAQTQVLAALGSYPADRVRPAVLESVRSTTLNVRLAALKVLGSLGNQSDVQMLAEMAAATKGPEQIAARATLANLKGQGVNDVIVSALSRQTADNVKAELLIASAERKIFTAKPLITESLASSSVALRVQALGSLRPIGTPSDTPLVLTVLLASADDRERTEAEKTVVALALKITNANNRSRFVRLRLDIEKAIEARVRLIALFPMIGDNSALSVLRTALDDKDADVRDAAVRALVAWPNSAAKDDVMKLARDSRNETHRLLAIAGVVRIIGLETFRDPEAVVADLRTAAGFAWRPEEQKLVLGVLVRFPCRDALDLANGFLREPSVKAEAQAAVDRIKSRLPKDVK